MFSDKSRLVYGQRIESWLCARMKYGQQRADGANRSRRGRNPLRFGAVESPRRPVHVDITDVSKLFTHFSPWATATAVEPNTLVVTDLCRCRLPEKLHAPALNNKLCVSILLRRTNTRERCPYARLPGSQKRNTHTRTKWGERNCTIHPPWTNNERRPTSYDKPFQKLQHRVVVYLYVYQFAEKNATAQAWARLWE